MAITELESDFRQRVLTMSSSGQADPHCAVIVALGSEFGSWTPKDNSVRSFLDAYRRQGAKSA